MRPTFSFTHLMRYNEALVCQLFHKISHVCVKYSSKLCKVGTHTSCALYLNDSWLSTCALLPVTGSKKQYIKLITNRSKFP